jgi:hypothetical protein
MKKSTMATPSTVANVASDRAYAIGTREAHLAAADAHRQAALAVTTAAEAKKHKAKAREHEIEAGQRNHSDSSSTAQHTPSTDEPDNDGKVENPLLTWARGRGG